MEITNQVGFCGQRVCPRLCTKAAHCPLGQERARYLLGLQRQRRKLRRLAVGQAIETNIRRAAGSFRAFQLQLLQEHRQKGKEFINAGSN